MDAKRLAEHSGPCVLCAGTEKNLEKSVNRLAIKCLYGVDSVSRSRLARAISRVFSACVLSGIREPHGANRPLDLRLGDPSPFLYFQF